MVYSGTYDLRENAVDANKFTVNWGFQDLSEVNIRVFILDPGLQTLNELTKLRLAG
jgi:hypothetical protein